MQILLPKYWEKTATSAGKTEKRENKQRKRLTVSAFPTPALPESGSMGISQAKCHPCKT